MTPCDQCGKPALYNVMGHPLCLDCFGKHQSMVNATDRRLKEQYNLLIEQAEAATGLYGITPRYKLSEPVIHQGAVTINRITVDNSVVGALNTGMVRQIEVALDNIHVNPQNADLEAALKDFTEKTIRETSITADTKNEILEQLAAIATVVATQKKEWKPGILKALLNGVAGQIASTGLADLWSKIRLMIGH